MRALEARRSAQRIVAIAAPWQARALEVAEQADLIGIRRYRWLDLPIIGLVVLSVASGFGQFGVVAALGDVAKAFGTSTHTATLAEQAGLSGTELGVGLAIIRLASLGALGVSGLADRFGRRAVLLGTVTLGLSVTALAAASPSYWWFVAIFAAGRPLLSATNALAQVAAAEQTGWQERAKAVAFVTAGYGVGAGLTAIVHSLGLAGSGFRILLLLALVPLGLVALASRWVTESDRFHLESDVESAPLPVLGAVGARFRHRLAIVVGISFTLSVISGPANSFVFLYAQNILHQSGGVTAAMVVGAGFAGLIGLLAGRWLADHVGRRFAGALGMVGAGMCSVIAYSEGGRALQVGYVGGIFAASVFAPALGSLVNELFPTSVRASVAGWWVASGVAGAAVGLVVFGTLVGTHGRFLFAGTVTFLPATAFAALFFALPESKGKEPEELSPDAIGTHWR